MAKTQSRARWRRGLWVPVVAMVALLASGTWLATQQPGPGRAPGWGMGSGWGSDSRGDDFGMMGGSGYDGMMGDYTWSGEDAEPVENLDQARARAAAYADDLQSGLEVGEVMRFDNHYYADLQEPDATLVTEVLIDPRSGAVRPEMGPATMWNTRAGMMGGSGGSDAEITGMLSVHDTTGDVWYHSWHDDFVEMSEHS